MEALAFIFLSLAWGCSFIFMKIADQAFGPLAIASGRVLLATLVLFVFAKIKGLPIGIPKKDWWPILGLSFFSLALPFVLQPWLIHELKSSFFPGQMIAFVPIFTVLVSIPLLKRYPSILELIGVLGGLAGLLFILKEGFMQDISLGMLALCALTPLTYAIGNTYVKRRLTHCPPTSLTFMTHIIAGLPLLGISLSTETIYFEHLFPKSLTALVLLGVVSTGIASYVFTILIQKRGPLFAGMVGYTIPIVCVFIGWMDQEVVSAAQVIALIVVLFMVALVQYEQFRRTPKP